MKNTYIVFQTNKIGPFKIPVGKGIPEAHKKGDNKKHDKKKNAGQDKIDRVLLFS